MHVIEFEQRVNGKGVTLDWVHVSASPVDARYASTWSRVKEYMPTEQDRDNADDGAQLKIAIWETDIEPAYNAWKSGKGFVVDGTPLSVWMELPKGIAKALTGLGFQTVEQVAEMTASDMERLAIPDTSSLKRSAANYLDAMVEQRQVDATTAQAAVIAELQAKIEALEAAKPKPKRGRPPKMVEEPETEDAE